MAKSVALVAFGSTWTIMVLVAFRTQWLRSAVMFLLPMPCSVSSANVLPLVRLLLVLIVIRSVIPPLLVLSLGNNDEDESSNDDDDDDDVEKDEEEEKEHLALADPFDVSTDDLVPSS
nr:hypothetical protein [Tanacetum cinerariifolium]